MKKTPLSLKPPSFLPRRPRRSAAAPRRPLPAKARRPTHGAGSPRAYAPGTCSAGSLPSYWSPSWSRWPSSRGGVTSQPQTPIRLREARRRFRLPRSTRLRRTPPPRRPVCRLRRSIWLQSSRAGRCWNPMRPPWTPPYYEKSSTPAGRVSWTVLPTRQCFTSFAQPAPAPGRSIPLWPPPPPPLRPAV